MDRADSGLYILWMRLASSKKATIGSLGTFSFGPGFYAYVGSAQKNRRARIERHLRREKPLRWHIDYFRPHADIVAVSCVPGRREDECRLVARLKQAGASVAAARFGASDCRCEGHLLLVPARSLHSFTSGIGWPSGTCFKAMELMQ